MQLHIALEPNQQFCDINLQFPAWITYFLHCGETLNKFTVENFKQILVFIVSHINENNETFVNQQDRFVKITIHERFYQQNLSESLLKVSETYLPELEKRL